VKIKVKLFGHLPYYIKGKPDEIELDIIDGSSLEQLLEMIKAKGVPLVDVYMVSRVGRKIEKEEILKDGDLLEIIPVAAGG